jgi:glutathione S-transferase
MTERRRLIHSLFLIGLPIVVAWFGMSTSTAIVLVILLLLWRWAISLSGIVAPETSPGIVLETITASHFAEKVRWCLDRLDIEYVERQSAGVLGVVFSGRTVPRLKLRTGIVRSSLGNSPQILRYLWGAYAAHAEADAQFLEPTAERLALEKRIDRYGVDLQVWVYYHLLPNRDLTLRVWGVESPLVPWWQKQLLRPLFPVLAFFIRKTFSITDEHFAKAVEHIDHMLADIDTRLADGRCSILGGDTPDFVDIAFASMSGLWLQPPNYGGGKAEASRLARNRLPAPMQDDIERWIEDHPKASAFVARLYAEERGAGTTGHYEGQIQVTSDEPEVGAEQ